MEHATVVLLVLALAYFAFDKFVLGPRREAALVVSAQQAAAKAATKDATQAAAVPTRSIAVLPLANAGASDQQFFADGLSEALIVALSQFDGLKVIGRNSAFQFRDSKEGSRAIGAKLGVRHLLEGSVQHAGDAVRISLELIDAASGQALWSQRYDRPYKDLFKLQDDITAAVAGALKTRLQAGETQAQSDRPPSGNLDAYNAYLLGQFYLRRNTEADARAAITQLQRAVEIDPAYGAAYGLTARVWTGIGTNFAAGEEMQRMYANAQSAVDRALALAPGLAATHAAYARLLMARLEWRASDAEIRRALELAPEDGEVLFLLGRAEGRRGRLREAVILTQRSLVTDPLNARNYAWLATYLLSLDRMAEAEAAIDKAIELEPKSVYSHVLLTIAKVLQGDASAALVAAEAEPVGGWRDFALALAAQVGQDRAAADARLKEFIARDSDQSAFQIAEVQALRDDPDAMFEWLERARMQRDPGLESLLMSPLLRRHLHDPRFAAFARSIGLPAPVEAETDKASAAVTP
jgi:TolB-like protein/Tfp pilus assembly protein PilF